MAAGGDTALNADSTRLNDSTKRMKNLASKGSTAELKATSKDTSKTDTSKKENALIKQMGKDTSSKSATSKGAQTFQEYAKKNPLFAYLNPAIYQNKEGQYVPGQTAMVGRAFIKDTAKIDRMLRLVKNMFPRDLKLAWTVKPGADAPDVLSMVALKITSRDGSPALGGDVITNARQDYDQNGRVEVSMSMNSEGARIWKRLTGDNIGKQIAIVLDGYVYSYPNVNGEIPNGMSSITAGT